MSRLIPSLFAGFCFALTLVAFQNCADPLRQPSFIDVDGEDCVGDCVDPLGRSADQLGFEFFENQILVSQSPTGRTYVELSGYCNDGRYPYHTIHWRIYEYVDSGGRVTTSLVTRGTLQNCKNGEFDDWITLPAQYDFSRTYELEGELIAEDEQGRQVAGPMGIDSLRLIPQN